MTDDEYNCRVSKIRNKLAQVNGEMNSENVTHISIDIETNLSRIRSELDDLINEIEVEDFLANGAGNIKKDKYEYK